MPDDDPLERQRAVAGRSLSRRRSAFVVRALATKLMTVKIDLD
jgi:hypothetical protein